MPRPAIDEGLVSEIRRIHRSTQGEAAGSFQEALDTVVQLAVQATGEQASESAASEGWYPGKYAGIVFDDLSNALSQKSTDQQRRSSQSWSATQESATDFSTRAPESMAIFKTRLGEDNSITIPTAEADALELESDELLQVYAYALRND